MITSPQTSATADPTQGLVDYVTEVKPYHTKILDVLVEYVWTDSVNAVVREKWQTVLNLNSATKDVVYVCGYGWAFDATIQADSTLVSKIISADTLTNSFLIEPSTSAYMTVGGYAPLKTYNFAVANDKSSQFVISEPYQIVVPNPTQQYWSVLSSSLSLSPGQAIYVSGNTGNGGASNGKYTVTSTSTVGSITKIYVSEPISFVATSDGFVNVPIDLNAVPAWPMGLQVLINDTNGTMPSPLTDGEVCYFIPTNTIGVFNLAKKRYPTLYDDYLHVSSFGSGNPTIKRDESFSPGSWVSVDGSFASANNGMYNIIKVVPENTNFRAYVTEKVIETTPLNLSYDGVMSQRASSLQSEFVPSSWGSTYCPPAQAPDFYVATFVGERLEFQFSLGFSDVDNITAEDASIDATILTTGPFASHTYTLNPVGFDLIAYDIGGFDSILPS